MNNYVSRNDTPCLLEINKDSCLLNVMLSTLKVLNHKFVWDSVPQLQVNVAQFDINKSTSKIQKILKCTQKRRKWSKGHRK